MKHIITALFAFYITLEIKDSSSQIQIEVQVSEDYYDAAYVGKRVHYRAVKRGSRPVVKVARKTER